MRKIVFPAVAIFIVVAASIFSIAWFLQARQIRLGVERALASLDAQQLSVTYDAINTSGFPSDVLVSIVNPHIKGRVDTLLKTFAQHANLPNRADIEALRPWDEDIKLNGQLVLGINALSDHYSVQVQGEWDNTAGINNQSFHSITTGSGGSCVLQLARTNSVLGMLWDYQALARDMPALLHDFRLLDCNISPMINEDAATHAPLLSSGGWRIYLSRAPQGEQQQLRLFIKSTDMLVTAQGDAWFSAYAGALSPLSPLHGMPSSYGKQSVELDASYSGPTQWPATNPGSANFDAAINSFTITNDVYHTNATFHISNASDAAHRASALAFHAQSAFSEAYTPLLRDSIYAAIVQAANNPGRQPPPVAAFLQSHGAEDIYANILPAIPDLHVLGDMTQALDLSFNGSPDFKAGDVKLATLEFTATPYGITGNGSVKLASPQLPTATAAFTCTHCPQLIDDVAAYTNRIRTIISTLNPQTPLAPYSPQLIAGIKNFAAGLSEPAKNPAAPDIFTYTIISNGLANTTISGKRLDQVITFFNQTIAPYLPQTKAQ